MATGTYDRALLLKLWDKAVGTEGYDKEQWHALDTSINQLRTLLTARIGEAAFPETVTIRDQFATAALQGMLAFEGFDIVESVAEEYAQDAYSLADAMMEARKK